MDERVTRLERKTSGLCARLSVVENDLKHGANIFSEMKADMSRMLAAMYRIAAGLIVTLSSGLIATIVYIFNTAQ